VTILNVLQLSDMHLAPDPPAARFLQLHPDGRVESRIIEAAGAAPWRSAAATRMP
jgi:hypothetical protein